MTKKERDELSEITAKIDNCLNDSNGGLGVLNLVGELHGKVKELIKDYDERRS